MGIGPKTLTSRPSEDDYKICSQCGASHKIDDFAQTKSFFYPDKHIPICIDCINQYLTDHEWNWRFVDKLCQYADVPFIPKEWVRVQEIAGDDAFLRYCQIFLATDFEDFGWKEYYDEFIRLREEGDINSQIPEVAERERRLLVKKWNANYSDEEFSYLEDLLDGMYKTQNINTKIQQDDALKLCKISLEIDSRIREGSDVDKLLGSYEKLVKIANFTPKNSKAASDLESVGELCKWLEAGGWKNRYYDDVSRDVVDETMKNSQSWTQRLYVNETGIGEEISRRIEALKIADQLENGGTYGLNEDFDLLQHEVDGYNELKMLDEDEDFIVEVENGDD